MWLANRLEIYCMDSMLNHICFSRRFIRFSEHLLITSQNPFSCFCFFLRKMFQVAVNLNLYFEWFSCVYVYLCYRRTRRQEIFFVVVLAGATFAIFAGTVLDDFVRVLLAIVWVGRINSSNAAPNIDSDSTRNQKAYKTFWVQ